MKVGDTIPHTGVPDGRKEEKEKVSSTPAPPLPPPSLAAPPLLTYWGHHVTGHLTFLPPKCLPNLDQPHLKLRAKPTISSLN